jgi:signal transduction histidine kinase
LVFLWGKLYENTEGGRPQRAAKVILKLCVFSDDLKLVDLCLEVACALSPDDCEVVRADRDPLQPMSADLFIWDLDHTQPRQGMGTFRPGDGQDQLFVVDRQHVDEFLRTMPLGAGSTLIKPVKRSTLHIFVEQAAVRARTRQLESRPMKGNSSESDRHDLLQCLLMANLKLQEYDQNRTNFLARAVHDFRAPLTAASGYCGLLREEALGPLNDDQIELLGRMNHSLKKLTRMASEMFELSVGRQVDRRLELKETSIEACVRHALHEIEPLASEKKISVTLKLNEAGAPLYLDAVRMEQVLVNLLENACKFTPREGQVHVHGYATTWTAPMNYLRRGQGEIRHAQGPPEPKAYRIDVSDTGSGISAEHLEDVFEEYTSYSGSQDRSGGGLGLAICRMFLTAHGGCIWAENHSTGAKLSFVLPLGDLNNRKAIQFHRPLHTASLGEASFTEGRSCN